MKHPLSLLFISLVAVKAQAFVAPTPAKQMDKTADEAKAGAAFSILHAMNVDTLKVGVCDAVSVNGCGCPFCTQLRNAG